MVSFTLKQALDAVGGRYFGDERTLDERVLGVTIDSRAVKPGFLYIPIKGERFDGHSFIPAARESGALCCLSENYPDPGKPTILVKSALAAFQALASFYRSLFDIPFVGITGSVGKTTTKELVAGVLMQKYNVLKNEGNLNNQTGVPITIMRLESFHEAAVIEMGTNHFGEIGSLSSIVRPKVCVLTNVGEAHLEHFGSKDGILKAKSEMFEYMEPGGTVIINGDDPLLATLLGCYPEAVTYGLGAHNRIRAKNITGMGLDGTRFTVVCGGAETELHVPSPGTHMVMNALAAFAAGRAMGVAKPLIQLGISSFEPSEGRMDMTETGGIRIINDAYNANPTSMKASICIAAKTPGRSVCVLGDMFELGENEAEYHKSVGKHAADEGAGLVLCVGNLARHIYEGAAEHGAKALYFPDKEALLAALPDIIKSGDTVLVKASHGMHLETVAEWLKDNY